MHIFGLDPRVGGLAFCGHFLQSPRCIDVWETRAMDGSLIMDCVYKRRTLFPKCVVVRWTSCSFVSSLVFCVCFISFLFCLFSLLFSAATFAVLNESSLL